MRTCGKNPSNTVIGDDKLLSADVLTNSYEAQLENVSAVNMIVNISHQHHHHNDDQHNDE